MDKTLSALAAFHITGERVTDEFEDVGQLDLRPALFGAYRDLHKLRYDEPLVLVNGDADGTAVRSLADIVDEILGQIAPRGATGERARQHLLRLEAEVRTLACNNGTQSLTTIWDDAGQQLLGATDAAAQEQLRDTLARARDGLRCDGEVVKCDHELPAKLVTHAWTISQRQRAQELQARLDELTLKLSAILQTDFMHSAQAHSAQNLKRSMGSADEIEFDFEAMSRLLCSAPAADALPEARRRRISSALSTMRSQRFVAAAHSQHKCDRNKAPFEFVFDSCERVLEAFQQRLPEMAKLVKAMTIAQLEIDNRYDESKHDAFFHHFAHQHLRAEDFALFPSYLVCLCDGNDVAAQHTALWQVLSCAWPIKVLLQFDDLLVSDGLVAGIKAAQLASMAISLGKVFVLQSSNAFLYRSRDSLKRGLASDGPALFSVFCASVPRGAAPSKNTPGLAPYLLSAAATQSRAFPGYTFDPHAGTNWASRFHLHDNPQPAADWPLHDLHYEDASLQKRSTKVAFTFVDFAACDRRCAKQLARVPQASWHDGMLGVNEFLDLDNEAAATKVPYIWMIDEHDRLHRVIVEDSLIDAARHCRERWRSVQELAGINNSHAQALLAAERASWQLDKEQELAALRSRHEPALANVPGEDTLDTAHKAPATHIDTAGDTTGDTAGNTADEAAGNTPIDEPYIETPRCTTCNECTELNNKMFAYNDDMQAYIADLNAGTYRQLVEAAESCQVAIIHPGQPRNVNEPGLDELLARADAFN